MPFLRSQEKSGGFISRCIQSPATPVAPLEEAGTLTAPLCSKEQPVAPVRDGKPAGGIAGFGDREHWL